MKAIDFFVCFTILLLALPVGCSTPANLSLIELAEREFTESNWDSAREYCNQAIEQNAGDADAYILRGRIWLGEGDIRKAIIDYTQAIRLRPENADAYYYRADALAAIGNKRAANEDRNLAHLYDPNYKKAFLFEPEDRAEQSVSSPVPENAEELADSDVEEATKPNKYEVIERRWNLKGVVDSFAGSEEPNSADDENATATRSVIDRMREDYLENGTPNADAFALPIEQLELPDLRRVLPNAWEKYAEELDGVEQYQQLYKFQPLTNSGKPGDLAGEFQDQSATPDHDAPTDEKQDQEDEAEEKKLTGRTIVKPYHHRWRLGDVGLGQLDQGIAPLGNAAMPVPEVRPTEGIRITGIQSGKTRSRQTTGGQITGGLTTGVPKAGTTTNGRITERPSITRWRQFSRPSQGIYRRETKQAPTEATEPPTTTYRREYLLPAQTGAPSTKPGATGIRSGLTP